MAIKKEKYIWTKHSLNKLNFYNLSKNRIIRVIRFPKRIEEGIVFNTIAVMQPAQSKKYQEIWAMYQLVKNKNNPQIKIITVWRYPGKSPLKNPIPPEILEEIKSII